MSVEDMVSQVLPPFLSWRAHLPKGCCGGATLLKLVSAFVRYVMYDADQGVDS
jgi:hypothetical protein